MEKRVSAAADRTTKRSYGFYFSALAAAVLFVRQNTFLFLTAVLILAAVCALSFSGKIKFQRAAFRTEKIISLVLTAFILCIGISGFAETWLPSDKAAMLAAWIGVSVHTLLIVLGTAVAAVGFWSVCCLMLWLFIFLNDKTDTQRKSGKTAENCKKAAFCAVFTLSAFAFIWMSSDFATKYKMPLLLSTAAAMLVSVKVYQKLPKIKTDAAWNTVLMLTAAGICRWAQIRLTQEMPKYFPLEVQASEFYYKWIAAISGAVSLFFVYCCLRVFAALTRKLIFESGITEGVTKREMLFYAILLAGSVLFIAASFMRSNAFYGGSNLFDVIYTSDCGWHVKTNTYLTLSNLENDIRQPLFAVFAAPFVGFAYLVGSFFGNTATAICIASAQAGLFLFANFILAKTLRLSPIHRMSFMLFFSSTYTYLLFILMMEQYITAYFWLMVCVYFLSEKDNVPSVALCAAGGTLLTSLALVPFSSQTMPNRDFKKWFTDMVKCGCMFLGLLFFFGRSGLLLTSIASAKKLAQFTGKELTWIEKLQQYTEYIRNCFFAPHAGVNETSLTHISWQLEPVTAISIAGVIILALVLCCVILDKKRKSSLAAGGWIVFSMLMLIVLGWGTKENGLILYSLYFGWAFIALLFRLAEIVQQKLKIRYLVPVLSIAASVLLAANNIPAVWKLVQFAGQYYPA